MAEFSGILYRKAGGTTELNRSVGGFCVAESAKLEDRWQDGGAVDLTLITSGTMTFYDGDYIVAKGKPYEVRETISEYTAIDDTRNKYTIKLHYPDIRFKSAIMYNTIEQYNGGTYSWMRPNNTIVAEGSFQTLVETCCYNANEVAGERVFKVGYISEDIDTDFRILNFSDTNCWATLKQTCENWGTFYTIRANTDAEPDSLYIVDFGVEPETFPQTIKIGKNQGISELSLNYSDGDVYTQFIVLGGTENLPSYYPEERLQLDTDTEATPPIYDYSMMVKADKYTRWGRKRMELVYDDIKPTRTGTITGIPESNIFAFFDTSLAYILAEEPTWNPVGGTVHVVEGPLLGYTFEIVGWHAGTQKITIKQIVDSNGFKLPNEDEEVFRFTVGTKYNLANIRLPESYMTDAKLRLLERAIVGVEYWSQPRASFSLSVDPFFTRREEAELVCGMLVPIKHDAMDIDKSIRIKRIEYDLLREKYFDVVSVEVSDIEQDNYVNNLHKEVQRTIKTIKTAGYVNQSVTKANNITTLYNSIVSGYGFTSYDEFAKWCEENQGIMIQALEGESGSEELVHIINADLLRVNDAFVGRLLANEIFVGGVQDTTEGLVNNFLLHLTSSVSTVACDSDGNVIGSLPSSQAIVYHGASADTGWAFGKEVNGCTATVNESSGAISIDTLTADDATVTITATKAGKPTLIAIMRISKVYAGVDGTDGDNGVGITETTITYAVSSSGTTAPGSGWQSTPPAATAGQFMWTKTVWAYSDSSTETGYSVGKIGDTGATGSDGIAGADGVGLTGTTITYAVSSSGTTAPGSGWQSTPPAATAGQYMWTKTVWTYSDSSTETGYSVGKIGEDGTDGINGIDGTDGIDGSDGTDSTTYYLLPSVDVVIRSMNGTATPSTVSCAQWKVTGAASPVVGDKTLKYKRSIDESESAYTTAVTVGESLHIDFLLYSGETLLWSTRVPVLQDLAEWESTLNDFAKGIGYADGEGASAYEKLVAAASAGTSILTGGYLRTSLIDTTALVASEAFINSLTTNSIVVGKMQSEAQAKVDAVQVGGRNLLLNTATPLVVIGANNTNQRVDGIHNVVNTDLQSNGFVVGENVILSYKWKAEKTGTSFGSGYFYIRLRVGTPSSYITLGTNISVSDESNSGYVSIPIICTSNFLQVRVFTPRLVSIPTDVTLTFYDVKLEKGNKPTDWTPAPEDVQEDYATKLGYPNYANLVAKATAGSTIISGGYLNTDLIEARSIVAGKIATGTITANEIKTGTITANKLDISSLTADSAFIESLATESAFIDELTGNTAFITAITAMSITADDLLANNAFLENLATKSAFIEELTGNTAFISALTVNSLSTVDSDGTSVSISNSAYSGKAGVVVSGSSGSVSVGFFNSVSAPALVAYDGTLGTVLSASGVFGYGGGNFSLGSGRYTVGETLLELQGAGSNHFFISSKSSGNAIVSNDEFLISKNELYISALPTSTQTGGRFWSDSKGHVMVGAASAYTASDVGAVPTTDIQYFTQSAWNALNSTQKAAIKLAIVY